MFNNKNTNVQYFAINSDDKDALALVSQLGDKAYKIDGDRFDRLSYAYNKSGSNFLGIIWDEPKFHINPAREGASEEAHPSQEEMIESRNWFAQTSMRFETEFWTDKDGKRHCKYSYINLVFTSPTAKRIIMKYHKGDSIMAEGKFCSMPIANPQDESTRIIYNYLEVNSFLCNGGQSIRKEAIKHLTTSRVTVTYTSVEQIINDPSLTTEEKTDAIAKFYQSQPKTSPQKQAEPIELTQQAKTAEKVEKAKQTATATTPVKQVQGQVQEQSNNPTIDGEYFDIPSEASLNTDALQEQGHVTESDLKSQILMAQGDEISEPNEPYVPEKVLEDDSYIASQESQYDQWMEAIKMEDEKGTLQYEENSFETVPETQETQEAENTSINFSRKLTLDELDTSNFGDAKLDEWW